MKYVIHEGKSRKDVRSKSRLDAYEISERCGFSPIVLPTKYASFQTPILKGLEIQIAASNLRIWMQALDYFSAGDILLIQFPLLNSVSRFDKFLKACQDRLIHTIALVQDLNSIRYTLDNSSPMKVRACERDDMICLPEFDAVISQNEKMQEVLEDYGVENLYNLGPFDYLYSSRPMLFHSLREPVSIVLNQQTYRSGYLFDLADLKVPFELYGEADKRLESDFVHLAGIYQQDNLVEAIHGSFGLIWDGKESSVCKSDYLKYHYPHRFSLYMACGLPVIVSKESALAELVEEYDIGKTIDSLQEIEPLLQSMDEQSYIRMQKRVMAVSEKVREGEFLKRVLGEISFDSNKYEEI